MATSNKTQIVLSRDNNIIATTTISRLRCDVSSARQPLSRGSMFKNILKNFSVLF